MSRKIEKSNINLLSISGKKQSGKNQTATFIKEILEEEKSNIKYEEKAFAYLVKKIASELTGIPIDGFETNEDKLKELGSEWDTYDNNGLKIKMTRRLFLQKLGTNTCNMNLHYNTWVNVLFQDWNNNLNWIITDVRFPQECESIKSRKGIIIRVERKSLISNDNHASETSLDNYKKFDFIIKNDGTLEELKEKVRNILKELNLI